MAHHRVQQWATFARTWWIYDAKWQCPFKSAPIIIKHLEGRHKPIFHPLSNCGDHVVIINTKDVALKNEMWRTFRYTHHTGYPGGFSAKRAWEVHEADLTKIMYKAVYSNMKGTLLRRHAMQRLHLFPDENVPSEILKNVTSQIKQIQPTPIRLDEFSQEERDSFPRLFEWPEDYVPEEGHVDNSKS